MTEKVKSYVESKWFIIGFSILFCLVSIVYGVARGLEKDKADKLELTRVEKIAEKNCDKIDETKEMLHSMDKRQAEILTILKGWNK